MCSVRVFRVQFSIHASCTSTKENKGVSQENSSQGKPAFLLLVIVEVPNFSHLTRLKTSFSNFPSWGRGLSWSGTYFQCPLGTQHITDLLRRLCEKHHRTLGLVWLPWSGQTDGCVLEHSAVTLGLLTCLVGLFPAGYLCCLPSQTASPFLKQWLRVMNSAVRNTNVDDKRLIKKQFRLSVVSLGTKQSQWPYTANVNKTTNKWQHKSKQSF